MSTILDRQFFFGYEAIFSTTQQFQHLHCPIKYREIRGGQRERERESTWKLMQKPIQVPTINWMLFLFEYVYRDDIIL